MNKKLFSVLVGMSFVLGVTAISAAPVIQEITAKINYKIVMKLNGSAFAPRDASGKELRPITYEGSTYVPLRAIGEALNIAVDYNPETYEVFLGEKDSSTDFIASRLYNDTYNHDVYPTIDPNTLTVNGDTFASGFVTLIGYRGASNSFSFNTNNNFASIEFDVSVADKDYAYKVKVLDTKRLIIREAIVDDKETVHIKAPIGGLDKVIIEITAEKGQFDKKAKVVIGDIIGK